MNTCSRTYLRLSALIFWIAICLAFPFPGNNAFAKDYIFTWDANHPNDMVVEYRIYYRANFMTEYHSKEFQPIAGGQTTTGKVYRPDNQEGYCFAIKAVDEDGFSSEFSENEEGDGNDCDHNPNDLPFIEDNDNSQALSSSGGGGGGCFLSHIIR